MNRFLLLIVTILCLTACESENNHMSVDEVKSKINQELQVGKTTCKEIELFLKETGWGGSYDRFSQRYQVTIRLDENGFEAISVYLYVNGDCVFTRSEVDKTYTSP